MSRWKFTVCGAALVSAACGTVTITEHVSTAPTTVRSFAVATADPGLLFAQSGTFVVHRAVLKKVGTSRGQSPVAAPAQAPAKEQPPAALPALPSNPCSRTGKASPMCPVASP